MTAPNTVTSHFPYLPVRVSVGSTTYDGDALLDTGFSGGVMMPSRYLPDDAPLSGYVDFDRCTVEVYGFEPFETNVAPLGDTVLVGVHVISKFYVLLDHGERVVVSQ